MIQNKKNCQSCMEQVEEYKTCPLCNRAICLSCYDAHKSVGRITCLYCGSPYMKGEIIFELDKTNNFSDAGYGTVLISGTPIIMEYLTGDFNIYPSDPVMLDPNNETYILRYDGTQPPLGIVLEAYDCDIDSPFDNGYVVRVALVGSPCLVITRLPAPFGRVISKINDHFCRLMLST